MKEISQKSYALYMKKQWKWGKLKKCEVLVSIQLAQRLYHLNMVWNIWVPQNRGWRISWPDSPSQERRDGVVHNKHSEEVKIK